jgi:hypothetical protein
VTDIADDIIKGLDLADVSRVGATLYVPVRKAAAALEAQHYAPRPPHPDTGEWCQGAKYPQHVYQGDRVVALYIDPDDAAEAVDAVNEARKAARNEQ